MRFKIKSKLKPAGDQPVAIRQIVKNIKKGVKHQILLGVTGSGKTFAVANVIHQVQKPTLVISHNKTLTAQLTCEFRELFPENAVEYFVSYYDYYQPEAYLPVTDTYIEKEAMINDEIDKLRHRATQAVLSRNDVIICASVSCIYGLGSPENYRSVAIRLTRGQPLSRIDLLRSLVQIQYQRTNTDLRRGQFRLHGENFEIMPSNQEMIVRVETKGQIVSNIFFIDPVTRKIKEKTKEAWIFPARHFVTKRDDLDKALDNIRAELKDRLEFFIKEGRLLEAERLERRTKFDLEMIKEIGICHGIENYSRHLSNRLPGEPPETLIDYFCHAFGNDWLLIIDESHVTIPQLNGMYEGDRSRKQNLIDYGFRLPSAADNRPLKFHEFEKLMPATIYMSATPGPYEREKSCSCPHHQHIDCAGIVEMINRPTGLVDPELVIKPIFVKRKNDKNQVEDLIERIKGRVKRKERVLVTTLTKKMAEDLTEYLIQEHKIKAVYLHSDVETLDRIRILTDFRKGIFDVLVGVNLLREGLDLPEVTLVAILDADKEGFLRSETSLIQTIGRAARNVRGQVVLYADEITSSMHKAIEETNRRRKLQLEFNRRHGITPETIKKKIKDIIKGIDLEKERKTVQKILELDELVKTGRVDELIRAKEKQMKEAAENLQFELATILRDEIKELTRKMAKD